MDALRKEIASLSSQVDDLRVQENQRGTNLA
jgi:hypothetical protein